MYTYVYIYICVNFAHTNIKVILNLKYITQYFVDNVGFVMEILQVSKISVKL